MTVQDLDLKKVVGVVVVVILLLGVVLYNMGFLDKWVKSDPNANSNTSSSTTTNNSSGSIFQDNNSSRTATDGVVTSNISIEAPPLPVGGRKRGVVMLGPSGLYLYVVDTDGRNVKLVKKSLQSELVQENVVDPSDIKAGIKRYIGAMYELGVDPAKPGDVQFITASSTASLPQVSKIVNQLKEMGVVVTMTTSAQEGQWAFNTAVAPQYRDKAVLVDITPSITRVTGMSGGTTKTVVVNAGSKTYVAGKSDDEIKNVLSQFSGKQYCFVIWAASEEKLRGSAGAYSGVPVYNGNDVSIQNGLNIANTAINTSRAQGVFAWEAAYPMGFLNGR